MCFCLWFEQYRNVSNKNLLPGRESEFRKDHDERRLIGGNQIYVDIAVFIADLYINGIFLVIMWIRDGQRRESPGAYTEQDGNFVQRIVYICEFVLNEIATSGLHINSDGCIWAVDALGRRLGEAME